MKVNNVYMDFGLITSWSFFNFVDKIKEKAEIPKLKKLCEFVNENKEYFQYYQLSAIKEFSKNWKNLSFNIAKKDIYTEVSEVLNDLASSLFTVPILVRKKDVTREEIQSFDIKDAKTYAFVLDEALAYTFHGLNYLDFIFPKYLRKNSEYISDDMIQSMRKIVQTEETLSVKEKTEWEDLFSTLKIKEGDA